MSAPLSDSPLGSDDTTCCGCLRFPIFAKARRITSKPPSIRQNTSSTALPLQPVNHVAGDVPDAQRKDGNIPIPSQVVPPTISGSPPTNHENGGVQHTGAGGLPTPVEAHNAAKEPLSINDGDGAMQRGGAPPISFFQGASNVNMDKPIFHHIQGDATFIRFGDGQFTEVQRYLIGDYIATLATLPGINENMKKHILTQLIINLPRAEAVFNDYQTKKKSGPCFEGTRVALLREMADWITGSSESRMYVVSGLAGIGKSTIAYTIASRAADLNLLGASFFFSRDEADRNNAKKLFTTIAYQLCVYDERFSEAVGNALQGERGSAAITKDPQEQLEALILDPLRSIVESRARPILLVVDALDECCEDDMRAVIKGLSQLVRELPSFKVILTTRPNPYLEYFLGDDGSHKLFRLQDIEDKIVDDDIRVYLKYNLSLEKVRERLPKRRWCASDEDVDSLVRAAGRLFIIASTTVRYILDKPASNPAAQMQALLRASAQDHTPFKDLDHFYTIILRNAVPEDCDNDNIVNRYQAVVGAIIFLQHPLPISALSHLINIDTEEINAVLDNLQSVILLGDDDIPHIYHKSFPDYVTDKTRCKDPLLWIDRRIPHTQIARCCFEIMNKHLKYNILGLSTSARFMSNKDGLKADMITDEQLQEKISEQLRYACVYGIPHLEDANIKDSDLMGGLAKFVNEHTLHWFEVLSLIGKLDSAHRGIQNVLKYVQLMSSLDELLTDALRFISKFYEIISRSALHTYYSALPFTPTNSALSRRYMKDAEYSIFCIEGGQEKWDAVVVASSGHGERVDIVKFSADSTLFYSRSEEQADNYTSNREQLKILDAATGTPISTIPGCRFAVTDDFSTIASSEENIITFYDVNGSARGATITTSSQIQALAHSSETRRVVAALSDGTVWLWESGNAELVGSFDAFEGTGYLPLRGGGMHDPWLQFSPTGTRFAYTSTNGTIRLRDGITGRLIADLQCSSMPNFVFSGDGSRIASLPYFGGLTVWNTENGGLVGAIESVHHGLLAISANGSLLATADHLKVTLWYENFDSMALREVLELRDTTSMAFSQHKILAIGIVDGVKLYNVESYSFVSTLPLIGWPVALAFSPDSTRLACGNNLSTVYLWDIGNIDASSPRPSVTALALSRDCSRLACGFSQGFNSESDGAIELWETSPTMRRIAFYQGKCVSAVGFGPDGKLFASGSNDIIKLWNGEDGSLGETLNAPNEVRAIALSKSVLVVGGVGIVTLWDLDMLRLVHTFEVPDQLVEWVSISDESHRAAIATVNCYGHHSDRFISVFDVVNRTTIATFDISDRIQNLTFLPDKPELVVQFDKGDFLLFNLVNERITEGPMLKHLIHFPITPLWHGVPIWYCSYYELRYVAAMFPQHERPVPVLFIPTDIRVSEAAQGSSMIALGSWDGRIILLRLPTTYYNGL